jgi:transcriptional regulator with XRE-family HTH domain
MQAMEKLKEILRKRDMTQLELAIAAEISPFRLSRLMHKRSRLRHGDCRRISRALGVPIKEAFSVRKRRPARRK